MNKTGFITELKEHLHKLPEEARNEIISDYEEHFSIGIENGKDEESLARELGDPKSVAKEFVASFHLEKAKSKMSVDNVFRALFAAAGLGFINIFLLGWLFMGVIGVIGGFYIGIAAMIGVPWIVYGALMTGFLHLDVSLVDTPWLTVFPALFASSLGIIFGVILTKSTILFFKWTLKYIQFNLKIIKGGSEV